MSKNRQGIALSSINFLKQWMQWKEASGPLGPMPWPVNWIFINKSNLRRCTSAVIASAVSGVMLLLNGVFERRARLKETLLTLAFHLAKERTDLVVKLADKSGGIATLRDSIFLAEGYHKWLQHLYSKGVLPKEAHDAEAKSK